MPMIQRADLVEKIRRAFNLVGADVGSTVSPELVPVVLAEDLTGPTVSEGYPRLCAGRSAAGSSVGVFAEVFLINPAESTVDLVVQECWLSRTAAGAAIIRAGPIANLNNLLGTQPQRVNLDLRVQVRPNALVDSRNQAATVTATHQLDVNNVPASVFTVFPLQWTVPPGFWLSAVPTTNNTAIEAWWYWTERVRR